MKKNLVELSGYSIQSNSNDKNGAHLKSWIIEGSNNENEWIEIDKRVNNYDLKDRYKIHYFEIKNKANPFRYIRLRMIYKDHANQYWLGMSKIEFFGSLYESSTQ